MRVRDARQNAHAHDACRRTSTAMARRRTRTRKHRADVGRCLTSQPTFLRSAGGHGMRFDLATARVMLRARRTARHEPRASWHARLGPIRTRDDHRHRCDSHRFELVNASDDHREARSTWQTVASTHHSFVVLAQLSDRCARGPTHASRDGRARVAMRRRRAPRTWCSCSVCNRVRRMFAAVRRAATKPRCARAKPMFMRVSRRSSGLRGRFESRCAIAMERLNALRERDRKSVDARRDTVHRDPPNSIAMELRWRDESRDQHVCRWCWHRGVCAE